MKNYEGMTINNWHILKAKNIVYGKSRKYICRCLGCGNISEKTIGQIKRGKTGRCSECPPNYQFKISNGSADGVLPDGTHFLVDEREIERISRYNWKIAKGYIERSNKGMPKIKLHQFIMGFTPSDDFLIDHINRNPLDCRRENLRIVTRQQNCMNKGFQKNNKTGFTGVYFDTNAGKYASKIGLNDRRILLCKSADPVDCAQAYNIASEYLFGEFRGHQNDVPKPGEIFRKEIIQKLKPYTEEARKATENSGLLLCLGKGA